MKVLGVSWCFLGYKVMFRCTMTMTCWAIFVHSHILTLHFDCTPFLFSTTAGETEIRF